MSDALGRALRETFGLRKLRPGQRSVMEQVLAGRDTLAILPSGAGKSLCYQLPAVLLRGTTVVVSPLVSLMKDQADRLGEHGVEAATVTSALSARGEEAAIEEIEERRAEIVFTTPERMAHPEFRATLSRTPIDLLVIDEAHCISQWGHDFRPAYLELAQAARALGDPTVLALTATATPDVVDDIRRQLGRPGMQVIDAGLYRPNLRYVVRQVTGEDDKRAALLQLLRETRGAGIVYTATVRAAEALAGFLREAGMDPLVYHGRLPARVRSERQDAFMGEPARLLVATNAFGMGVDKRDIRFVIHYQVPGSLEAYCQESGRAGRDGEPARCTLLYDHADRRIQQFLLVGRDPAAQELRAVHERGGEGLPKARVRIAKALLEQAGVKAAAAVRAQAFEDIARLQRESREAGREKLERMSFYAHGAHCRWKMLLEYFGDDGAFTVCGSCDNCLRPPRPEPVRVRPGRRRPPPQAEPGLRKGDAVEVPRHGRGLVELATAERVVVSFPDGKTREFLRSYVTPLRADA